jgi:PilZ domain
MLRERNSTRHKSLLRGIVYFENSPFATECVVRDLSGSGARLEFAALPLTVAERLDLQIPARGDRHRCRIIWRSDMEIGIAFADALTACEVESIAERAYLTALSGRWDEFYASKRSAPTRRRERTKRRTSRRLASCALSSLPVSRIAWRRSKG